MSSTMLAGANFATATCRCGHQLTWRATQQVQALWEKQLNGAIGVLAREVAEGKGLFSVVTMSLIVLSGRYHAR